jgi:hypothetical protein
MATFSLLDRYPLTAPGHVAFLEFVRDETQYAAQAKRQQLAKGYSNQTLTNMVCGIKWAEARSRVELLAQCEELAGPSVDDVADLLRRELSVGTVDQIDSLLTVPMHTLRDALEQSSYAGQLASDTAEESADTPSTAPQSLEPHHKDPLCWLKAFDDDPCVLSAIERGNSRHTDGGVKQDHWSMYGKVIDLAVAILASGDSPTHQHVSANGPSFGTYSAPSLNATYL